MDNKSKKNNINNKIIEEEKLKELKTIENNIKIIQNNISESIKTFENNIERKESSIKSIQGKILGTIEKFENSLNGKDENIINYIKELKEILNSVEEYKLERKEAIDLNLKEYENNKKISVDNEIIKYKLEQKEPINEELNNKMKEEYSKIEARELEIEKKEQILKIKERNLNNEEKILELERKDIEDRIEDKYKKDIEYLKNKLSQKKIYIDEKIEKINELEKELENKKMIEKEFGDVEKLKKDISEKEEKIRSLKDNISEMAPKHIYSELETLKEKYSDISNRYEKELKNKEDSKELQHKIMEYRTNEFRLENDIKVKTEELESLKSINTCLTSQIEALKNEFQRISNLNSVEKEINREERIKEIREKSTLSPIESINIMNKGESLGPIDKKTIRKMEISWLNSIKEKSEKCGLFFDDRILYSFHTALKISDYSIITVLAGVSGTGKSELPRYYSTFGGLNYINISVKPNWDSQESMLGYFNAIDNRFDSEPLLSFLFDVTDSNNPRSNVMSLVLLDEMNLAHVEYYFAEFLSKLESRRGLTAKSVPKIEVKLGTGIKPYELPLSRTLLWAGTMNQDETTKSLSDKVLDRGVVINFPRPEEFHDRINFKTISSVLKEEKIIYLNKYVWDAWLEREISGELINVIGGYKKIVERINNEALSKVGRALGHRVWQAISFYIANHPLVIKFNEESTKKELKHNSNLAFIDQIVQKIVPKLRGIETNGVGKECLDKIVEILTDSDLYDSLNEDFELAMKIGYGQFIWSSSNYLKKGDFIKESLAGEENEGN